MRSKAAALLASDGLVGVAVAPDSYIRQTKQREPYWPQAQRERAVSELRAVTWACTQDDATPAALIRSLRPAAFVKGIDWARALPPDVVAACREVGCLIVYVDTEGTHTSEARR
jgi:bifunctional ADP-heptose synthase (sugar kinase/adenylyltransferase)